MSATVLGRMQGSERTQSRFCLKERTVQSTTEGKVTGDYDQGPKGEGLGHGDCQAHFELEVLRLSQALLLRVWSRHQQPLHHWVSC